MPTPANFEYNEVDLTFSPAPTYKGIYGLIGQTLMGEINNPKQLISSWPQFVKYFGGLTPGNTFPLVCKKALDRGCKLRICRVVNYTDITNSTTLTPVLATINNSLVFTFSATNLKAGDGVTFTINGTTTPSFAFSLTHNNTMEKLAAYLKAQFPLLIQNAFVLKNVTPGSSYRTIIVVKKSGGAALATFSGAVTGTPTTPTITATAITPVRNSGAQTLLTITPKARGAAYNALEVYILPPSNGTTGFFNIQVTHSTTGNAEEFKNIKLVAGDITLQSGLQEALNSALITITTPDLSAYTDFTPIYGGFSFETGTNGSAVTDTDYIGDSNSNTGLYSFGDYDDITILAIPEKSISNVALTQAGVSYAESRKDLVYFADVPNSLTSDGAIMTAIDALGIDSSWIGYYGGGNKTTNPANNTQISISILGDILGLAAQTHTKFGPHYSFAGQNRGKILNTFGPVNNFGAPGEKELLKNIASRGVNLFINRNTKNYLSGNFTGQKALSALSYMNVRFLMIDVKRTLGSIFDRYLEELDHWDNWLKMYHESKIYLDKMADAKAFAGIEGKGWSYQGDQFVSSLDELTINNAHDVTLGKYKILLFMKPIVSLQEISLSAILTPGGITFEEAGSLI